MTEPSDGHDAESPLVVMQVSTAVWELWGCIYYTENVHSIGWIPNPPLGIHPTEMCIDVHESEQHCSDKPKSRNNLTFITTEWINKLQLVIKCIATPQWKCKNYGCRLPQGWSDKVNGDSQTQKSTHGTILLDKVQTQANLVQGKRQSTSTYPPTCHNCISQHRTKPQRLTS